MEYSVKNSNHIIIHPTSSSRNEWRIERMHADSFGKYPLFKGIENEAIIHAIKLREYMVPVILRDKEEKLVFYPEENK